MARPSAQPKQDPTAGGRTAAENREWGYRRFQGALAKLGHEVAHDTIANILKEHGLEPAPERYRKTTWKEFLARHRKLIVAANFFTIEAWTPKGLTRFLVLFLIDLSSRKVEIAGVARQMNGLWMSQMARNLTDGAEGFLVGKRDLIYDRDPLFTTEFLETMAPSGVQSVQLPGFYRRAKIPKQWAEIEDKNKMHWQNGKETFEGAERPDADHDAGRRTYAYMITEAVPKLLKSGVSREEIHTILVDNPRRFFCAE